MKPLAIVSTHPIQYQAPFYRYLAARGVPLHVFFLCDRGLEERLDPDLGRAVRWDIPLLEGYGNRLLPNIGGDGSPERFLGLVNPGVLTQITKARFCAVIVHGYRNLSMLATIMSARARHLPILYRSESNLLESAPAPLKLRLGKLLLGSFVSACLSIGTLNDEFYEHLGVPNERRFLVPYAVDNERFAQQALSMSKEQARSELRLPTDGLVVLFAGKLVPWKQPDLLLKAFSEVELANTHLAFVGDGSMREGLACTSRESAPGRVSFLGFLNQGQMGLAYRSADVLVLPSLHEPWGLVVNEAMNFHVPALISDRVGCGPDLVTPGATGDVFHHDSVISLRECLVKMLSNVDLLRRMGGEAKTRIQQWGYPQAEVGLRKALGSLK